MTPLPLLVGCEPRLTSTHRARLEERLQDADGVRMIDLDEPLDAAAAHLVVDGDPTTTIGDGLSIVGVWRGGREATSPAA